MDKDKCRQRGGVIWREMSHTEQDDDARTSDGCVKSKDGYRTTDRLIELPIGPRGIVMSVKATASHGGGRAGFNHTKPFHQAKSFRF
ncbi:hypothetical protein ACOMHN_035373 [Nucella lapillus]